MITRQCNMKRTKKYELISKIHYCDEEGDYVDVKQLSEPGFEPWIRFRSKVTTTNSKGSFRSVQYNFIYSGNRGILKYLPDEYAGLVSRLRPPQRVKIKRKMYQKMLKQVHEKTPLIRYKYLLGWPGGLAISTGILVED